MEVNGQSERLREYRERLFCGQFKLRITRVFRVRIDGKLRNEFERNFASISVHTVTTASGFISTRILKPTKWSPDEYAMILEWQDEAALKAFAGEDWSQAVIPSGMERFVVECWVHHYADWE